MTPEKSQEFKEFTQRVRRNATRTSRIDLRCTQDEKMAIETLAREEKRTVANYILSKLLTK
jgi:uncharacterized protein (DUF1778 family)